MFHTEYDSAVFIAQMLTLLGTLITAGYSIAVVIALALKTFRRPRPLFVALVLSGVVSAPLVAALVFAGPYLPRIWDWSPGIGVLMLVDAALLCFVWLVPVIQYLCVR